MSVLHSRATRPIFKGIRGVSATPPTAARRKCPARGKRTMLNKVMLIGHLGRDPELRYTQTGAPIATLNIATDESYTDRDGNKVERTEWHRVSVFQRQAENCANYLSKGSLVYVEGSLQTRKWQDQNGQDRYTTEIKAQRVQFLDRRGANTAAGGNAPGGYEADYGAPGAPAPRQQRGGNYNAPRQAPPSRPQTPPQQPREDLGPAFPSEASMDEVPF